MKPARDTNDRERRNPFYSCAFCSTESEKPFKICKTCGQPQPELSEEE